MRHSHFGSCAGRSHAGPFHRVALQHLFQGADGVAFIADSQVQEVRANQASFKDLRRNLKENGIDPGVMPIVIQYNKRDLPNIRSEEDIMRMAVSSWALLVVPLAVLGAPSTGDLAGQPGGAPRPEERDANNNADQQDNNESQDRVHAAHSVAGSAILSHRMG